MTHLERLATLGTLAAGLVHEINNPLAYVLLTLERVALSAREIGNTRQADPASQSEVSGEAEHDSAARLLEHVDEAREAVENVAGLVKAVRSLARGEARPQRAVDVGAALDNALRLTAHELRKHAQLLVDVRGKPFIIGCAAELEQVFINLLINAAQAVCPARTDGEIRVSLRGEGSLVITEVRDNGMGIPPQDLCRVFDPFYTTKVDGLGTGLGLSISKCIVAGLGGSIGVVSRIGGGSTFRVELPAHDPTEEEPLDAPASSRVMTSVSREAR